MNGFLLRIALLAPALLALTVTSASAVIVTTKGVDTRYSAAREAGSVHGRIGQIRAQYRTTSADGQTTRWEGPRATAFLVSPCHAITNNHVMSRSPRVADGAIINVDEFKMHMGPPANGKPFSDRTPVRVVAKGQHFDDEAEAREAYKSRYVANAGIGLSPVLERDLSTSEGLSISGDWALVKLETCLGERYGYFEIEPVGTSSITGANTPIELAGHPLGVVETIVSDNCRVRGARITIPSAVFRWGYSHEGVHKTDCTLLPGNSGSPVYFFDARGAAKVIGVAAVSTHLRSRIEEDVDSLKIPREHVDEFVQSWGQLGISSGYVDIRQALLSPIVRNTLKPYQPSLRALGDGAALRDYHENAVHFHDAHSREYLLSQENRNLRSGFLYLKLAKLNRQFGNADESVRFERLARESMKSIGWAVFVDTDQAYVDPATMIDNLSLIIDAWKRMGVHWTRHISHRQNRIDWALRVGNFSLAREDLQAVKQIIAEMPQQRDILERAFEYGGYVNLFSGNYVAAVNEFAASRAGAKCPQCFMSPFHLRALLFAYGKGQPKTVAAFLNDLEINEPTVRYRLAGEEFKAPLSAFNEFYAYRDGRAMAPLSVENNGVQKAYDANEHGDGGLSALLFKHAAGEPHVVAKALQQKLRDDTPYDELWFYYELDGVRYVALNDDFDLFWQFRFGRGLRDLGYWAESSTDLIAQNKYLDAIASANIEMTVNPDDLNAHLNKARAQQAFGVIGTSLATYSDLIDRFATSSGINAEFRGSVHYLRGSAYLELGKVSLARADFKRASDLVPANQTYRAKAQGR